ncbi:MAG TPA: hypothetical protein VKP64_14745 [Mycobacteriales bacterium]|nr:hypothetical protein [Mycobacteriales bacterium]
MSETVDFGLTDDANARLASLLDELAAQIRAGELTRTEMLVRLSDGLYVIAEGDRDAVDQTTRIEILRALEPVLTEAGMTTLEPWEF